MENKHTPGPWSVGNEPVDNEALYIYDNKEHLIASADTDSLAQYREEALANARLIAAAPDMLEALQRVAAWIGCNVFPPELHHIDELRLLHAAIAKAQGK